MNIIQKPSGNYGYPQGVPGRNGQRPLFVCHHITQGSAGATISWFQNPASQVSTHYLVARDGAVYQFVNELDAAWGQGAINKPDTSISWIADQVLGRGISPNKIGIGIEHEGFTGQPLTEPQIAASIELTQDIFHRWGMTLMADGLVGHNALDSVNRAGCPGPSHPWDRIRAALTDTPVTPPDDQGAERAALTQIYLAVNALAALRPDSATKANLDQILVAMNAIKVRDGITP